MMPTTRYPNIFRQFDQCGSVRKGRSCTAAIRDQKDLRIWIVVEDRRHRGGDRCRSVASGQHHPSHSEHCLRRHDRRC